MDETRVRQLLRRIDAGVAPQLEGAGALCDEVLTAWRQRDHAMEVAEYWYQAWLKGDTRAASKRPAWMPDADNPDWVNRR